LDVEDVFGLMVFECGFPVSEGAEAVINLVGTFLTIKYDVDCTAEEFTGLFTKDSASSTQKLSDILGCIAAQEEKASVTR
jgi:hypothetical protein